VSESRIGLKKIQLDDLFGHLCSSTGLYSKETFQSLYSCITRMVRDHHMPGFVMTRTLDDDAFEPMAQALEDIPGLPMFRLNESNLFPSCTGASSQTGFLIVLTNRLCATLFWSAATQETFRMYNGGWTFHPGDSRTIALRLIQHLQNSDLENLLAETQVDRRYDDKLNLLITSLVHGLENRNRELTLALDQVKVLNKRNVDTERLAAIGQMSSVIAHEIRNPLGLIDLYAKLTEDHLAKLDLAEQADKKALLLKNLSQIRQATGSLETILSELTDYSRPLQLHRQPTDIQQLVQNVCEFYQPSYQEREIALSLNDLPLNHSLATDYPLDGDKIKQALINLLKNALEASPAGTTVSVSILCPTHDPNFYVQVQDQGKGIDPLHVKKLFTPYFSTKGSGTGLGLAHSQKILQAHGGNVELISSMPGLGSTFALILPRSEADTELEREHSAE
jgi:signal transduction histidine kinase